MVVAGYGVTLPQSYEVGAWAPPSYLLSSYLMSTKHSIQFHHSTPQNYKTRADSSFLERIIYLFSCSTRTNPSVVCGVLGLCEESQVGDLSRRFGVAR